MDFSAGLLGNGHHEEAPEAQQSLFSWAEFMAEEPVKSKGRNRKPQPATLSMFEWALTLEQEQEQEEEEEPVGAGRPRDVRVARVRPARRIAQVEELLDEFGQAEAQGQGGRQDQPGIGHQAVVVEGDLDAVGVVAW